MPNKDKPRTRYVFNEWHRDPHGELLPKPPPKGKRTPSGIVWAHTLNDFFWIRRLPGVNVMTIWSRSMVEEFGENHLNAANRPEPKPRRLRPWPVLRLPSGTAGGRVLGLIDETCDSTHSLEPEKLPDIPEVEAVALKTEEPDEGPEDTPTGSSCLTDAVVVKTPDEKLEETIDNQIQKGSCATDTVSCPVDRAQATAPENNNAIFSGGNTPTPNESDKMSSSIVMITPNDLGAPQIIQDSEHIPSKLLEDDDQEPIGAACALSEADAMAKEQASLAAPHVNLELVEDAPAEKNVVSASAKPVDSGTLEEKPKSSPCDGTESNAIEQVTASDQTARETGPLAAEDQVGVEHSDQQTDNSKVPTADSNVRPKEKRTPKLEEFIPERYFPDILLVNDPDGYTYIDTSKEETKQPLKYKRVWPRFQRDTERGTLLNTSGSCASTTFDRLKSNGSPKHNIAHLNLASTVVLGTGHHSVVRRAPLRLPPPLTVESPTQEVTVAVKIATNGSEARGLLNQEGRIYNAIPQHLMEDWCGLNLVAPMIHPVPAAAVVPKFYGFYIPVREEVEREKRDKKRELKEKARQVARAKRKEKRELALKQVADNEANGASGVSSTRNDGIEDDSDDSVDEIDDSGDGTEEQANEIRKDQLSPILLLEECGSPILPNEFSPDDRSACYSMLLRLHQADIAHNSHYIRNILVQPGPLTLPPSQRSVDTPSFRIIDLGRSDAWSIYLETKLRTTVWGYSGKDSKKQTAIDEKARLQLEERIKTATTKFANEWFDNRDYELRQAQEVLKLVDFDW